MKPRRKVGTLGARRREVDLSQLEAAFGFVCLATEVAADGEELLAVSFVEVRGVDAEELPGPRDFEFASLSAADEEAGLFVRTGEFPFDAVDDILDRQVYQSVDILAEAEFLADGFRRLLNLGQLPPKH
jgi:hypothetical protein